MSACLPDRVSVRKGNVSNARCRDIQNAHLTSDTFRFRKPCNLLDNYEKYATARRAVDRQTQYNGKKVRFAFRIIKTKVHRVIMFDTFCFRPDET
jgi:hypothetical protein